MEAGYFEINHMFFSYLFASRSTFGDVFPNLEKKNAGVKRCLSDKNGSPQVDLGLAWEIDSRRLGSTNDVIIALQSESDRSNANQSPSQI